MIAYVDVLVDADGFEALITPINERRCSGSFLYEALSGRVPYGCTQEEENGARAAA
jgi:hypothetical protein